jgi:hypothetical protein
VSQVLRWADDTGLGCRIGQAAAGTPSREPIRQPAGRAPRSRGRGAG